MAGEIYIADKVTLDSVKKDTNDIKLGMANNLPEQLTLDKYNIIGLRKTIYTDAKDTEIISINSEKGGLLRLADIRIKTDTIDGIIVYNPVIKIIVDDVIYELIKAKSFNPHGSSFYLRAYILVDKIDTVNENFNLAIDKLPYIDINKPDMFTINKQFDDVKDKIIVKELQDIVSKNEENLFYIKTHGDKYIKFKKNFKIIISQSSVSGPSNKMGCDISFVGGIAI